MLGLISSLFVVTPAQAAVDLGTLTVGVQTVLDAAVVGEAYTYRVDVPAGKRLVFHAAPSSDPASTNLVVTHNGGLTAANVFGNETSAQPFLDVRPAAQNRTLDVSFRVYLPGTLPFTPELIDDLGPTPMTWRQPTRATLALAGQQATYTITGVPGRRLGISLTDSTFGNGMIRPTVSSPSLGEQSLVLGATTPGWVMTDETYTIRIDAVTSNVGSVTITAYDVQPIVGQFTLGATETVGLDSVWSQYTKDFVQIPGARMRLDVLASSLTRADGSPGGATFSLSSTSYPGMGDAAYLTPSTVTPFTVLLPLMSSAGTRTLGLRPDGFSTGSVTFRLSAQFDNPTVPGFVGTAIPVVFDAYNTRSYAMDLSGASRYRLRLTGIDLTSSTPLDPALSIAASNGGTTYASWSVPRGQTTVEAEFVPGNHPGATDPSWTFVLDPNEDIVGSATLLITPIDDVVVPLALNRTTTATMSTESDTIVFTYPGRPDGVTPSIVFDGNTLKNADGVAVPSILQLEQEGSDLGYAPIEPLTADNVGYTFAAPAGLDPTRPWKLRTAVGFGLSGALSLTLREPTVTRTSVAMGSQTTVRFAAAGDRTELTFTPRSNQRLVVNRTSSTVRATMELRTSSGEVLANDGSSGFIELPGRGTSEPVVLVITQPTDMPLTTGAVTVSIANVTDPVYSLKRPTTITWVAGANPRATFTGKKGTRVALMVSSPLWTPDHLPVYVQLEDGAGMVVAASGSLFSGGPTFLDFPQTLPADGTYRLVFDPVDAAAGSLTAAVSLVTDLRRTVDLGEATAVRFTQPGQRARLAVTLPRNRVLTWVADSGPIRSTLVLLDPNGQEIGWGGLEPGHSEGQFWTGPLPAGTYTVVVDPWDTAVGTVRLTLKGLKQ